MKAMILCAGLGTRLRPLTERWPKPAIPLLGAPLFRYTLAVLQRAGVTAVGINTHHLPEVMRQVAQAECERAGIALTVVHEPEIQGTGGGIRGLRSFLEDSDPFVVFNGDILFALELAPILAEHRRTGAAATMVLLPMPENEKFAAVEVDADRVVRRIAGHGPPPPSRALSPWHFSGVHVMSPRVFEAMSPSGAEDINREVYPRLMAEGAVRGAVASGYWSDLGTPSRYLATQRDVLFEQVPRAPFGDAHPLPASGRTPGIWRLGSAKVEGRVAGPACFLDCEVEAGAQIGSAVYVGPGAQVPAGARLNRAAVLDGTRLAPGEELVETIAWGAHRIPAPLG